MSHPHVFHDRSASIAIIGAGTAGLATARFLAAQGYAVTVFERADALQPVGAGLLLQPTGQAVLAELGLLDKLLPLCSRIDTLQGDSVKHHTTRSTALRRVMALHYRDLEPKAALDSSHTIETPNSSSPDSSSLGASADSSSALTGLGVHRANLCHVLADELPNNVTIEFGCNIHRYQHHHDGVELFSGHNRRLETSVGFFHAVVVANGSKSQLRPLGFCQPYSWGAFWSILPDRTPNPANTLAQRYRRADQMLGLLPSGHLHNDPTQQPLISLFWSVPVKQFETVKARGLEAWKQEVLALWPELDTCLKPIDDFDQLIPASYRDVYMRRWHDKRVIFIGDAGHGTSPQLGQGANLALVDAHVLSDCLQQQHDPATAWRYYSKRRRAQLYYYVVVSRWLTYGFQSNSRVLPWLRDLITQPLSNPNFWLTRPLYRQMLLTLAGQKHGLFGLHREPKTSNQASTNDAPTHTKQNS